MLLLSAKTARVDLKVDRTVKEVLGGPVGKDLSAVSSIALKLARRYKNLLVKLTDEKLQRYVCDQIMKMCQVLSSNYF